MRIKTSDGEMNVTSQGQGTLNTVLGAVGTAAALGIGTGILGGGRGNRQPANDGDRPVTRYEMSLIRESIAKDNEITLLKSQKYTDAISAQQAVYNGVNTATVQCLQQQIAQLQSLTKIVVPNANIAPGWGAVVVEPVIAPVSQGATTQGSSQTANAGN